MKNIKKVLQRPLLAIAAFAFLLAGSAPALVGVVSAFTGGQAQERTVQLSNSAANATGVTYKVSFKPTSTATIGGIVVDFCSDTPLVGTNCAYPAAFDLGATPTVTNLTGFSTSTGSWVTTNSLQDNAPGKQVLLYTNTTAQTPTGTSTAISFEITGVHNPSTTGSFYARILTFDTSGNTVSQYTVPSGAGTRNSTFANGRDFGGAAMATNRVITITARVMETLSMCVSADDLSNGNFAVSTPAATCAASSAPAIEIGTGTPKVIDNTAVYSNYAYFMVSSNAAHGVTVRMKATNTCPEGGITTDPTGADCSKIPGINGTNAVAAPALMTAGTAAFGLYVSNSALHVTQTTTAGTVTPSAGYHDGTHDGATDHYFGLGTDTTTSTGVTSTYGSIVASSTGALSYVTSQLTFGATASVTTPAGIYTGGEDLIATGSF